MGTFRRSSGCGALTLLALLVVGPARAAVGQECATVCAGDCDGDGEVTIDELLRAVGIALGHIPRDSCVDAERNDHVFGVTQLHGGADGDLRLDDLHRGIHQQE